MAINRVGAKGIASCTVAAQDIEDASLTNANFGPSTISNSQLANSSVTINGTSVSLGGSITLPEPPDWQAVTVADGSTQLTATAGKGYFLDTNTGVIEVFLPTSPSRGDFVVLVDYSGTFGTNQAIVNTGGKNIDSTTGSEFKLTTNNTIAYFVYVDAAKGWLVYLNQAAGTTPTVTGNEIGGGYDSATFIEATGGTVTTDGNFKIHSFTGDGCFVVSSIGNPAGSTSVGALVVAGGGGGGYAGGGGAGGFRLVSCHSVTAQTYPISVGGGGTGSPVPAATVAPSGSNSVFSTITSAGGGGGGHYDNPTPRDGANGGSGGGGSRDGSGGSGNTPPVSPPQGNDGGDGVPGREGGGGGAATAGTNGSPNPGSGAGGSGSPAAPVFGAAPKPFYLTDEANDSDGNNVSGPVANGHFAGGGAGSLTPACAPKIAFGSVGGGGRAGTGHPNPYAPHALASGAGRANSGGGGGGNYSGTASNAGKGIVLIRYKFQ